MTEKENNNPGVQGSDESEVKAEATGGGAAENNFDKAQETLSKNADSTGTAQNETPSRDDRRNSENWNIDLLLDVELPVRVSFGQTEMQLRDVFKLGAGSVIELDKSVNDPVTVIVNNKPVAKGEVVMVDGNYGVRILEVESTADRIRSLG